jgi:hypothetical protein
MYQAMILAALALPFVANVALAAPVPTTSVIPRPAQKCFTESKIYSNTLEITEALNADQQRTIALIKTTPRGLAETKLIMSLQTRITTCLNTKMAINGFDIQKLPTKSGNDFGYKSQNVWMSYKSSGVTYLFHSPYSFTATQKSTAFGWDLRPNRRV